MSFTRFPALFLSTALLNISTLGALSQQEATVSRIVDQFSAIESRLSSMQTLQIDASHADSLYGVGLLTVWVDGNSVAKVKNETRADDAVNIQEMWLAGNELIFFFERSEWHGNQDGTVSVNEYRYYLDNGRVIREMNRSAIRQNGAILDISEVPHQVNDDFETEYGKSLYDDKEAQTGELIKTARSLSGQGGSPPELLNWPYRLMLETLSPDARYAVAWGIIGVESPDWLRWERERYEYLAALGDPGSSLHLVDLTTGNSMGEIQKDFEPGGSTPYFWVKWSENSTYFAAGSDFRWATGSASIHRLVNGTLVEVADLAAALSTYSIDALRQADHPYAIDATEAMGFIDLKRLAPDGTMDITYAIESKFEGPRRNAGVDFQIKADLASGDLRLLSSQVHEFTPLPTSWEKFRTMFTTSAAGWISSPPMVEDYLQLETFIDDGILHLYNLFGGFLNQDLVEVLIQRPLFTSGPHYPGGVLTNARFEFGHYDPESIRAISRELDNFLSPEIVSSTRGLYNAELSGMAKHFQESLHYWHANPGELERQKAIYLDKIESETLPEYYYLLDGNLADGLMERYSEDWTRRTCYLTGLRFWLRRSCDGSYAEFANLLQRVIAAYDPAYFAYRGIPDLKLDASITGNDGNFTEAIMDETGVMGTNHLTPFDLSSLQSKLPGLDVTEKPLYDEGGQHPAFRVHRDGTEILTLIRFDSGDPLAFELRSSNIQLANGISTGDAFAEVFKNQRPLGLYNGLETDINAVMVEAPGSERITLMFQPPPGRTIIDLNLKRDDLADFVLTEMRWMP